MKILVALMNLIAKTKVGQHQLRLVEMNLEKAKSRRDKKEWMMKMMIDYS
jgi:hypothetical protein